MASSGVVPAVVAETLAKGAEAVRERVMATGSPASRACAMEDFVDYITAKGTGGKGGGGGKPIVFDVRSPAEFEEGCIPGAVSLPLFNNDERAEVGTCFKQKSAEAAMALGITRVSVRLPSMVEEVKEIVRSTDNGTTTTSDRSGAAAAEVFVYCFRGGLRSSSVAWLLQEAGLPCTVVEGGYKRWRQWARDRFEPANLAVGPKICVVGGRTGVGKTKLLHELARTGHQTLDLEGLASHRGSVFGWVGEAAQPSNEQFSNSVAALWHTFDPERWVYIEDEGTHVGKVHVPDNLYHALRQAPLVVKVNCSRQARLDILVGDYANEGLVTDDGWLAGMARSVRQLEKRLGNERVEEICAALNEREWRKVADMLLPYYDKLYDKHIQNETGTGSGTGSRSGKIVAVGDQGESFDVERLAGEIVVEAENFVQQ